MTDLYKNFENRFNNKWFATDWSDVQVKPDSQKEDLHKSIDTLQSELQALEEQIEGISLKQLRLANLSKMYNP